MHSAALPALTLVLCALPVRGQDLAREAVEPRTPLAKGPVRAVRIDPSDPILAHARGHRLVVKLADGVRGRAGTDGRLVSRSDADVEGLRAIAVEEGLSFRPLFELSEEELAGMEARAERRSGRAQPDLAGVLVVRAPDAEAARLEALGTRLQELDLVEYCEVVVDGIAPPGDIPPTTPVLVGNQGYRRDDPGMEVDYAWTLGLRGAGVRLSDCEYGWNPSHEELHEIDTHPEPGQTIDPGVFMNDWHEHGTAVLGETSAQDNGFGVSGMVPDAAVYTYPEWTVEGGFRRTVAISHAINDSSPGDIVMLEMQSAAGAPAEISQTVWMLSRNGTDAGITIVGAAGNGDQNLDGPGYVTYRSWGDSGALIVGAGTSSTAHSRLSFSSYGERVNLQGWGENVFSAGYGYFAMYGGDENQDYLAGFNGTSSATPFVASACVLLQSMTLADTGLPLDPGDLRDHLIATGRPQGSGSHIGPLPDLRRALDELCVPVASYCTATANSTGSPAALLLSGSPSVATNQFTLIAGPVPALQNGLFIASPDQASTPLGNGVLCLGTTTLGYVLRLPFVQSDFLQSMQYTLDLTDTGFRDLVITVGESWYFQAWFRDVPAGGAGFNFSDGVCVKWCP